MELVTKHAHGIAQIRLPMAGNPMRYVNAYVLEEDDGLTLVDCGWKASDVRSALDEGLAQLGATLANVRRLAVTHAHFDHYGLAGTLRREGVPEFYMHEADAQFARGMLRDPAAADRAADAWLEKNGMRIETALEDDLHYQRTELTETTHLLADGEAFGRLRAVHTPGHTPGHLCFVDERSGAMLTGDHVLPRVTPHVGMWYPQEREPLGEYTTSLRRVRDIGASRVLPAHLEPFDSLAGRVDELLAHHDEREQQILATLGIVPRSAAEVAAAIPWTSRKTHFNELAEAHQQFAVAETIAHLEHLRPRGAIARLEGESGFAYVVSSGGD